ncbi:MAG: hypothetical protein VB054_08540, partial [Petrimonas sp.]|nr:hypothetical protein [Petrimonas sp.]
PLFYCSVVVIVNSLPCISCIFFPLPSFLMVKVVLLPSVNSTLSNNGTEMISSYCHTVGL